MAAWANATVARLAAGDTCAGDFCGLVVICSWPMPEHVLDQYKAFKAELARVMPSEAYIYPASTLHCTVITLRAFTAGPMDAGSRAAMQAAWAPVLARARASEAWPRGRFRLRMTAPTLEGSAGIFRYEDADGAVERMRACLREAIIDAGGLAAEGGGDRSSARPLPGTPDDGPAPHMPDIVHSTVLRWRAEPQDRSAAAEAFARAAETWVPVDVEVPCARAVVEDTPYMHIPNDAAHVWWESEPAE
mmetsp:Transcript_107585/g.321719  ORF Transcript_107585/g.321719 Transcript_107585/m.321719 type:complete len:247 (-) Transcript_107585:75-815(-)